MNAICFKPALITFFLLSLQWQLRAQSLSSPNGVLTVSVNPTTLRYGIQFKGKTVLEPSRLGLVRDDADFSSGLKLVSMSPVTLVSDDYDMVNAKKAHMHYRANQRSWLMKTASGQRMKIVFRASNDGVAFRYEFPDSSKAVKRIGEELSSFKFPSDAKAWLQPKAEAQTGYEHCNPAYEDHYRMDIPVGTPAPGRNGWVFPALFHTSNAWVLVTEAALGRNYCGSALRQQSPGGEYGINFPEPAEVFQHSTLYPESRLPWKTPWRILAIGELKTIMESTLGTDLALPSRGPLPAFVKPGKSSWSWILKKDDSTVYHVQKEYIDFAARMNWQYCLIDANWDRTIGYDSVQVLADYAKTKQVGLLLWYNSAGDWNTVPFTPRGKLLTHASRMAEFNKLKAMGIKGIKVDFFGGDGQSMINYYQDILVDAMASELLVNFHGATLPRGWQRTYPNLITTEGVFGFEQVTFEQTNADQEPSHAIMCAMVRNAFDPMDFTPMNLSGVPNIKRVTTEAFELATSILFLSGVQHYAESPDGMRKVDAPRIEQLLWDIPEYWDDMKFLDGYPGKFLVVARRKGAIWYLAAINGEGSERQLELDLSFAKGYYAIQYASAQGREGFIYTGSTIPFSGKLKLHLGANDGAVMVLRP